MSKHVGGYSIIELMVVMAILGILAGAALPLVELTHKRNKERELKQSLWEIRRAIDIYKGAHTAGRIANGTGGSGFPPTLLALTSGVPDASKPGQVIYFLRRLPRDPFAPAGVSAERSWGLRSYASPPDKPQPGTDVFDVYSSSDASGLNGVPYRQW